MNPNDSIETTGPTVEQAINQALAQLGAEHDDVKIEVLITPRSGLLGLGARQARVRVTRRVVEGASTGVTSPPPAPPIVREATPSNAAAATPVPAAHVPELAERLRPVPVQNDEPEVSVLEADSEPEEAAGDDRRASRERAEPALLAREASAIMSRILELMGEKAEIEIVDDRNAEDVELNIKGDGSGLLIGRHGQTLDALEYVVNRILARKLKDAAAPVAVDTESYRARRRRQLHRMALAKGEQAKREHLAVTLEPMPPRDRRIIHLALKDDPLVTTRSSGDGFLRSVEIMPVDERREGPGARGREQHRERGRESAHERDRLSPAQQGGFKHGQKRIV
jgi:spoIIIJ-associated protein